MHYLQVFGSLTRELGRNGLKGQSANVSKMNLGICPRFRSRWLNDIVDKWRSTGSQCWGPHHYSTAESSLSFFLAALKLTLVTHWAAALISLLQEKYFNVSNSCNVIYFLSDDDELKPRGSPSYFSRGFDSWQRNPNEKPNYRHLNSIQGL